MADLTKEGEYDIMQGLVVGKKGRNMRKQWFIVAAAILLFFRFQVQANMVAYWDFNEGSGTVLHDKSGNGNSATIYGPTWAAGVSGSSLHFNGTTDYVELVDGSPTHLQQFTITCWVSPIDPYASQERAFFSNVQAASGLADGFVFGFNPTGLNFCAANSAGNGWFTLAVPVNITAGSYHFAACTYDGATMREYFDGALVGQMSRSGLIPYSSVKPNIGAALNNLGHPGHFNGNIDEMRIYNQALSASDLVALYNDKGTSAITSDFLIPVQSPTYERRPVLRWHPVTNASGYNIQVDSTRAFLTPLINIPTADTFFIPNADLPVDTIFWRVIAGINDTSTCFSSIGSFLIQDQRVPLLVPYEPKVTLERKPVFKWHPVSGAVSYTLQVGSDALFTNVLLVVPVADTQFSPSVDINVGPIVWRVKSVLSEAWSTTDMFQIVPDSIPMLLRYDGAVVATAKPLFAWHPVLDASAYTLEIANNSSFTNGYVIPLTDTSFSPAAVLANGKWFWRVSCSRNPALFSVSDSLVVASVFVQLSNNNDASFAMPFTVQSCKGTIRVTADALTNGSAAITLFTLVGKTVLSRHVASRCKTTAIDVSKIPANLYLIEIKTGEKLFIQKVMVRR